MLHLRGSLGDQFGEPDFFLMASAVGATLKVLTLDLVSTTSSLFPFSFPVLTHLYLHRAHTDFAANLNTYTFPSLQSLAVDEFTSSHTRRGRGIARFPLLPSRLRLVSGLRLLKLWVGALYLIGPPLLESLPSRYSLALCIDSWTDPSAPALRPYLERATHFHQLDVPNDVQLSLLQYYQQLLSSGASKVKRVSLPIEVETQAEASRRASSALSRFMIEANRAGVEVTYHWSLSITGGSFRRNSSVA
ncbi:hypothetical protein JCM11641_004360 [Rhodosporidiobolus odoratus]